MHAIAGSWAAALLWAALAVPSFAQNRTSDLRARFDREPNPVQKSKIMLDLGEAEFQDIRKDVEMDHVPDGLALLRTYRDEIQGCAKALEDKKIDAEKHPSGFKQLQISLQESVRRIDALVPSLTADDQAPFLEVRKELDELNRHLIEELFPGKNPAPNAPPNPAK